MKTAVEITDEGADTLVVTILKEGQQINLDLLRAAIKELVKEETGYRWEEVFYYMRAITHYNEVLREYSVRDDAVMGFDDMIRPEPKPKPKSRKNRKDRKKK